MTAQVTPAFVCFTSVIFLSLSSAGMSMDEASLFLRSMREAKKYCEDVWT